MGGRKPKRPYQRKNWGISKPHPHELRTTTRSGNLVESTDHSR